MGLIKGNRHDRKLEKFKENFLEIFNFFLNSYRRGLLTFGTEFVDVRHQLGGLSGRETFRRFEDGQYKKNPPVTRHVNIVHGVIVAKKSWGLHVKMWTEGIVDCDFTIDEIVKSFEDKGIKIPEVLLKGLINEVRRGKDKRIEDYLSGIK